jgi:hypothetical protein
MDAGVQPVAEGVKSLDGQGGIMTANVSGAMGMSLFRNGRAAKSRFAAKIAVTPGPFTD